jgi:pilus assembly protein CpaB
MLCRMDRKGIVIPLMLGVGAAVLYLGTLTSKERALVGQYERGRVLVARVDLPERTVLRESMFDTIEMPRRFMAQDAVEIRTPTDVRQAVGMINRTRIPKGNQIQLSALIPPSPDAGLALRVPPGYRGAVVPVDPQLKSLIKPGDRVDVLVTFDAQMSDGRREKATATMLQNILVLAVGRNLGQGMSAGQSKVFDEQEERTAALSDKSTISVALNPEELQYLALAGKQGETTIGVRGPGDLDMHPIQIATLGHLFSH